MESNKALTKKGEQKMLYEVVEIISHKTKNYGFKWFPTTKECKEFLKNKEEWNSGNTKYSITAWSIKEDGYGMVDLSRYGYKENVI